MTLSVSRVAAGVCAALALAFLSGCSSGSGSGLAEYFEGLETANERFAVEGFAAGQQEYDSVQEFMTERFIPTYANYVEALNNLNAAAEVEEEHPALVEAHRALLELFEGSTERFAALETEEELAAFFEEPDVAALDAAVVEACGAVTVIAEEHEVEFDGQC